MSGKPIQEPTNDIALISKSNPVPKQQKRNKKRGYDSPYDRKNDRKGGSKGQGATKSPHFSSVNSYNSDKIPSVFSSPAVKKSESLLNRGLEKFQEEKQNSRQVEYISRQGEAAIARLENSLSDRPKTSRGRSETPRLKFQQNDIADVSEASHPNATARDRMQSKPSSSTPHYHCPSTSDTPYYYVEKAWLQAVGSEEKHPITLQNDARIFFNRDSLDMNFRQDSPFRKGDIRSIRVNLTLKIVWLR
jgi:hypothetical protein